MFKINRSEIALLDFQYCHGNGNSIYMKELAYMAGSSIAPNYVVFKEPFDIRELSYEGLRTNTYCKKFVNGLDWSMGSVDYSCVGDFLSPLNNYKYIFVVGKAKQDFLLNYVTTSVINLENKISLKKCENYYSKYICPLHPDNKFRCALNNLFKLYIFVENNYNKIQESVINEIKY